jgi:hypothetical protein
MLIDVTNKEEGPRVDLSRPVTEKSRHQSIHVSWMSLPIDNVFVDANFSGYLVPANMKPMDTRGPANLLAAVYGFDADVGRERRLTSPGSHQDQTAVLWRESDHGLWGTLKQPTSWFSGGDSHSKRRIPSF